MKLIIATSKKTGNRYAAIGISVNGRITLLTLDKQTIMRALDMRPSELEGLACGEYNITEKGVQIE